MSITWTQNTDSRADLGPNVIKQQNKAAFTASDYVTGGYSVVPSSFGLAHIRALIPVGFSASGAGTPGAAEWVAVQPAISGPAATNPWFIKAGYHDSTGFHETASNNFAGGTMEWEATGY